MGKSGLDNGDELLNLPKTIVLVGKTGNGKSATGNSIVGAHVFDSQTSFTGVTATCQMHSAIVLNGLTLNVIDTPGLFDSSIDPKKPIGNEIGKCIKMAKCGIHAVVVVLRLGRFSMDEASAIQSLSRYFGDKFGEYMIVVFSHGDDLGNKSFDEFLASNCPDPLAKILEFCGKRHVVFDNRTEDEAKKSQQLIKLVQLIDTVVHNNGGVPFTNDLLFVDEAEADNGLSVFLEKIESKLRETTLMFEKQLAEERIARMEAEAKAKEAQIKSFYEINQLKLDLESARIDVAELQKSQQQMEYKLNQKLSCVIL